MKPYGPDLAHVHDAGFAGFSLGASPFLLSTLKRAGIRGGLVVDLGCGSGQWAERLSRAGYDVFGVDLSPAMVALARRRIPWGRFVAGSYLDVDLPRCVAATALGEVFNYGFDRRAASGLRHAFRRIHAALEPGGLFVFDVATPGRGHGGPVRHRAGDGWEIVSETTEDARKATLTRKITTFRKTGALWRRSVEVHRLTLRDASSVLAALRAAGFSVRRLRSYGKQEFWKGYAGFLARKRGVA